MPVMSIETTDDRERALVGKVFVDALASARTFQLSTGLVPHVQSHLMRASIAARAVESSASYGFGNGRGAFDAHSVSPPDFCSGFFAAAKHLSAPAVG